MNARTRRAALHAIAAIAILASANALAHSYAGLYDEAREHSVEASAPIPRRRSRAMGRRLCGQRLARPAGRRPGPPGRAAVAAARRRPSGGRRSGHRPAPDPGVTGEHHGEVIPPRR
jgi:hypothetical protein